MQFLEHLGHGRLRFYRWFKYVLNAILCHVNHGKYSLYPLGQKHSPTKLRIQIGIWEPNTRQKNLEKGQIRAFPFFDARLVVSKWSISLPQAQKRTVSLLSKYIPDLRSKVFFRRLINFPAVSILGPVTMHS